MSEKDSNMRKKVWVIVAIIIVILGAIASGIWISYANNQKMNQVAGVSIKIKEGTLTNTGGTFIITDTTDIQIPQIKIILMESHSELIKKKMESGGKYQE